MTTGLLDQNLSCRSLDMETFGGDCKVFDGNLYSESLALDTFPWFVLFANGYVDQDVLARETSQFKCCLIQEHNITEILVKN